MTIVKDPAQLIPGRWYAIGVENEFDEIEWGGAEIMLYLGEGQWMDEHGPRETVWDPLIQQKIRVSDADAFALQPGRQVKVT